MTGRQDFGARRSLAGLFLFPVVKALAAVGVFACAPAGGLAVATVTPAVAVPLVESLEYPAWFLTPGPALAGTVVSFAAVGLQRAAAESAAVVDARETVARARRVRIELDAAFQSGLGVALTSQGERFREIALSPVPDSVRLIASAAVRGTLFALVAGPRQTIELPGVTLIAVPATPPEWVRTLPRGEGVVYAVGVAPATFREAAGWLEADRHGRAQLAASVSSRVRTLAMGAGRDEATVTTVSSAVTLADLVVEGRWRDRSTCFVLVRGRVLEAQ